VELRAEIMQFGEHRAHSGMQIQEDHKRPRACFPGADDDRPCGPLQSETTHPGK